MSEDTRIQDALKKFGYAVTSFSASEQQIRLTLRVPANASSQWVLCFRHLLKTGRDAAWTVDVSRMYFLRGSEDKVFYTWRVIFQGQSLREHVPGIVNTILNSPRARTEVREIQLVGSRVGYQGGKGAQSIVGDEGMPAIAQIAVSRLRGG